MNVQSIFTVTTHRIIYLLPRGILVLSLITKLTSLMLLMHHFLCHSSNTHGKMESDGSSDSLVVELKGSIQNWSV
ncbi:hypothetical protein RHMOL_Rhmol11G0079800 [Rhododendron molle]|uniref:Uncharacterized protein n=1 Tax=Rhododendron molle TaxID=49168 RepID=A0ACC0LRD6_RHOML|nr:hypothetical protein RHMOL_Rhmol11G0079800 [Rhododendron molle]